jgi:hypothetical protein
LIVAGVLVLVCLGCIGMAWHAVARNRACRPVSQ